MTIEQKISKYVAWACTDKHEYHTLVDVMKRFSAGKDKEEFSSLTIGQINAIVKQVKNAQLLRQLFDQPNCMTDIPSSKKLQGKIIANHRRLSQCCS